MLVVCCPYAGNLCSCVIKTNTSGKNLVCGCVCVFPLRTFMSLLHCSATTPPPRAFSFDVVVVVVDEDDVADAFPCSLTK